MPPLRSPLRAWVLGQGVRPVLHRSEQVPQFRICGRGPKQEDLAPEAVFLASPLLPQFPVPTMRSLLGQLRVRSGAQRGRRRGVQLATSNRTLSMPLPPNHRPALDAAITRAALSTGGRAKSKFLSVKMGVF